MHRFQNIFRATETKKPVFSNFFLRFRDGFVCKVSLTVEIKLRFQIPPAGVVWTGLNKVNFNKVKHYDIVPSKIHG